MMIFDIYTKNEERVCQVNVMASHVPRIGDWVCLPASDHVPDGMDSLRVTEVWHDLEYIDPQSIGADPDEEVASIQVRVVCHEFVAPRGEQVKVQKQAGELPPA